MFDALFAEQARWFTVPALAGTAVFVLRIVLMLVAGGGDMDVDGLDADVGDLDDSGQAFSVLSVQGVAAFLMGFGWGGLGAFRGMHLSPSVSIGVGLAVGVAMVWFLALLMRAVHDMQSSGNIPIEAALGAVGDVYVSVPARAAGHGRVRIVIGNRQRIYNAVTEGEALPARSRVRVLAINDDRTLTVTAA